MLEALVRRAEQEVAAEAARATAALKAQHEALLSSVVGKLAAEAEASAIAEAVHALEAAAAAEEAVAARKQEAAAEARLAKELATRYKWEQLLLFGINAAGERLGPEEPEP